MSDVLPSTKQQTAGQDHTELATAVVDAVADAKGVSPLDLKPLATVIDTDALSALFRDPSGDEALQFRYVGTTVRIDGDGGVTVTDCDD